MVSTSNQVQLKLEILGKKCHKWTEHLFNVIFHLILNAQTICFLPCSQSPKTNPDNYHSCSLEHEHQPSIVLRVETASSSKVLSQNIHIHSDGLHFYLIPSKNFPNSQPFSCVKDTFIGRCSVNSVLNLTLPYCTFFPLNQIAYLNKHGMKVK